MSALETMMPPVQRAAVNGVEIAYYESGPRECVPIVLSHGFPELAFSWRHQIKALADAGRWVIAPDQRGYGLSSKPANITDYDIEHLTGDMVGLLDHLGVEKWSVFGGSWGSTLALAYAIKHPERVESLVLRGIFLLTPRELRWFYQDGASMLFPDAWARFVAPIPEAERGDMISAYHKRLTHPDRQVQAEAAAAWSQWEGDTISIRGPEARPSKFNEIDFAIAFARIECHFFANGGFFDSENWLLENAHVLKDIPGWIVQGRFDVVTPMESAWKLKTAWPGARFEVVWDAGHASTEPGIVDGLVRATDQALKL